MHAYIFKKNYRFWEKVTRSGDRKQGLFWLGLMHRVVSNKSEKKMIITYQRQVVLDRRREGDVSRKRRPSSHAVFTEDLQLYFVKGIFQWAIESMKTLWRIQVAGRIRVWYQSGPLLCGRVRCPGSKDRIRPWPSKLDFSSWRRTIRRLEHPLPRWFEQVRGNATTDDAESH